jgi:DNA mismatch endonuclease (patch repair protein)
MLPWIEKLKQDPIKWAEYKKKISEGVKKSRKNNPNIIPSTELKQKISNTLKNKYKNNEIINGFKNKKHSVKSMQLMSNSSKGQIAWNKGLTKDTDERVKKYSEKCGWSKGLTKYNNKSLLKMSMALAQKETKNKSNIETKIKNYISTLKYDYIQHKQIEYYNPDFVFDNEKKIIEVNGCYWHACPICKPKLRENKNNILGHNIRVKNNLKIETLRHNFLTTKGYKILYIWEHEINEDFENVKNKIIKFLEE